MNEDIRWIQRFSSFKKALSQLKNAVNLSHERELTELERQGLIQSFEFTFELSWNTMRDFLKEQGLTVVIGSKDAIRESFKNGLIINGETWMDMFECRNKTSHTYNEKTAKEISNNIINLYFNMFVDFELKMESLSRGYETK